MRSEPRVKRWLDRGWEHPAAAANAKHCQCCWLLAAPRSMPPPRLSCRSSAWSSPRPNRSEPGSAARSSPRCSTPPPSLRVHSAWDVETTSTVVALRTLARRAHAMLKEARELQKAIVAIIRSWRPDLLEQFGVGPIVAATVLCAWSHPGRDPLRGGVRDARRRRTDPGQQWPSHHPVSAQPLRRPPAQHAHCTPWSGAGSSTSQPPATTLPAALPKARPAERSNAAWPATSPATSTAYSKTGPQPLDEP